MRRIILTLTLFVALLPHHALAQFDGFWSEVDTLTWGPYDDVNPVVVHNAMNYVPPESALYVVFERHTAEESQIASVKFDPVSGQWDSVAGGQSCSGCFGCDRIRYREYLGWAGVRVDIRFG